MHSGRLVCGDILRNFLFEHHLEFLTFHPELAKLNIARAHSLSLAQWLRGAPPPNIRECDIMQMFIQKRWLEDDCVAPETANSSHAPRNFRVTRNMSFWLKSTAATRSVTASKSGFGFNFDSKLSECSISPLWCHLHPLDIIICIF